MEGGASGILFGLLGQWVQIYSDLRLQWARITWVSVGSFCKPVLLTIIAQLSLWMSGGFAGGWVGTAVIGPCEGETRPCLASDGWRKAGRYAMLCHTAIHAGLQNRYAGNTCQCELQLHWNSVFLFQSCIKSQNYCSNIKRDSSYSLQCTIACGVVIEIEKTKWRGCIIE